VAPVLASTRQELAGLLAPHRARDERVGLVCTMGAMHEGHASLMRRTRAEIGAEAPLVVSLFVNPLQFGPGEDLDRYPRTFDEDLAMCDAEGVDVLFAPSVDEVYPAGTPLVTVDPGPLATILEGASRPGHFAGVLTVVAKLFGLVRPEVTVFGEKDYQQLALVRRMSEDLCLGVEVLGGETVRETDGLALSSRNRYLDAEQRRTATALSRTLREAQAVAAYGPHAALSAAHAELRRSPGVDLDYLVVRAKDLSELPKDGRGQVPPGTEGRILIAARVGTTRLIDNLPLVLGSEGDH
jgi:pantoate--beta-alanine ligase